MDAPCWLAWGVYEGYGGQVSDFHGPVQQRTGEDVEETARRAGAGQFARVLPSVLYVLPNGHRTIGVTLLSEHGSVIHFDVSEVQR